MQAPAPAQDIASIAERTKRRVTRHVIPYLMVIFVIAQIDRVNIGYAGLQMSRELKFTNTIFGFGSGLFFIGYLAFNVPGTMLVELWSARKLISRLMIVWGIVSTLSGFIQTAQQFYWTRALLGAAEAAFFPGLLVYLGHWFPAKGRAKAVAMFMSAMPISQIIGAPMSAALINIHWLGYGGWRWLLIMEGLPAIIFGIITLYYVTDWPGDATWLAPEERDWIVAELEREKKAKVTVAKSSVWHAIRQRDTILLSIVSFCGYNIQYGLTLWLPQIVQKMSGLGAAKTTLVSAIPYLVAWPFMLLVGANSDRTDERRWHVAIPLFIGAAGLGLARATDSVALGIVAFCIASMGIHGRLPAFWSLPNSFFSGTSAAAVIATMNFIGITGGFVGPYIVGYLSNKTGSYGSGEAYLLGSAVFAGILILLVRRTESH